MVGLVVALLIVVVAGGVYFGMSRAPRKCTFCQPAIPIQHVNGKTVALQSRGTGGGPCEVPKTNPGTNTLGLDCKVRDPNGKVLETVTSTRDHDTC